MNKIARIIVSVLLCCVLTTNLALARSAVNARSASKPVSATVSSSGVATRGAGRTTVSRGTNSGTTGQTVTARAASTQKVINSSTKVTSATKNVIVSEACRQKYDGCMDSFCMIDNDNGGRCACSDDKEKLDSELNKIESENQKSYEIATLGVEAIENGISASTLVKGDTVKSRVNLSQWNVTDVFDDDGEYNDSTDIVSQVKNARGKKLHRLAQDYCTAQIPECANELSMLQLMYSQQIKSDCTAYENSLKQQKNASANKLASAQQAMRQAALEQYRNANKYDLGQCTTEFKKCMISTGGCGDDFSKCASVAAFDNTNANKTRRGNASTYTIQGATTTIEISSSTYDTLYAKKPLCENVTKQCMSVADQVWDTFLREVAPQVKSAELIAENETRQNCIGTISNCFQKACKDTIDPNNPDGSYDMCLSRPETMLNVCKVPLNACGIDATSAPQAAKSEIWNFVLARLSSMRADACTSEVKECLQSSDRCGKDYSQCVGLDTDTIVRMCPYDKLTGCQLVYGSDDIRGDVVYDELANMVRGIMLGIDNELYNQCQNAVNAAMVRVCGNTDDCNNLIMDKYMGTQSLEYKLCEYSYDENAGLIIDYTKCRSDVSQITDEELGRVKGATSGELGPVKPFAGVVDGTIFWEQIDYDENGTLTGLDGYLADANKMGSSQAALQRSRAQLEQIQNNINRIVAAIESDQTVQYCMTGRNVQGINSDSTKQVRARNTPAARFPNLTRQLRMKIAERALSVAREQYWAKYDALQNQMLSDYVTLAGRVADIRGENSKDARREAARTSCVSMADMASLPKSAPPPRGIGGVIVLGVVVATAVVVTCVFTFGAGAIAVGAGAAAAASAASSAFTAATVAGAGLTGAIGAATVASGAAGAAAVSASLASSAAIATVAGTVGTAAAIGTAVEAATLRSDPDGSVDITERQMSGRSEIAQWNYRETVTTDFDWDTLVCHKCVSASECSDARNPLFGKKWCKAWKASVETCTDYQF